MKYKKIVPAVFLCRINRFIAKVKIYDKIETVHIKNTGRCKELLIEGARVYLSLADNPSRKTAYDLIAVEKETQNRPTTLINMDSSAPNDAAAEWIKGGMLPEYALLKREVKYENSRFDFYAEYDNKKAFIEVKGVTLEKDGIALFPDAPTTRGVKHINELITARKNGYEAYILFIIQMKGIKSFSPNTKTHKEFADALKKAYEAGVNIICCDCLVKPDEMIIDSQIKVINF